MPSRKKKGSKTTGTVRPGTPRANTTAPGAFGSCLGLDNFFSTFLKLAPPGLLKLTNLSLCPAPAAVEKKVPNKNLKIKEKQAH